MEICRLNGLFSSTAEVSIQLVLPKWSHLSDLIPHELKLFLFPLCKLKLVLNNWLPLQRPFKEIRIFKILKMFKIFKRFFLSILNIQILNIVSSEPKEWTIHFDKFHYQNYFRKTHDPIFPLKKKNKIKKKKNSLKKEGRYRVYWRNKLRDLLKY